MIQDVRDDIQGAINAGLMAILVQSGTAFVFVGLYLM